MKDARVSEYIDQLPPWQKRICVRARACIHNAVPGIEETIKRTSRPYFTYKGNVCALLATKDHVNIFIYDPLVRDPQEIINQGHGNKTARAIQVYEKEKLNEKAFTKLISAIAENNEQGGWRKLTKRGKRK